MNNLYHLHIPRTSGTGILYSLQKSFELNNVTKIKNREYGKLVPGIFEFSYDKEKMKNWPMISGHFAANPIIENNGQIETFSVIREPIDHFISIAAYRAMSANRKFDKSTLDAFLEGQEDYPFECKLFSFDGNLQTKMLTCRIFSIKQIFGEHISSKEINENAMLFVESDMPKTKNKLVNKIKNIKLFEINQRKEINNYLIKQCKEKFDCDFWGIDNNKINSSVRSGVMPSPAQVKEIESRNHMDMELYDYVMSNGGES